MISWSHHSALNYRLLLAGWKKCCHQDRCQQGRAGQLPSHWAVMSTCHALPEAKIQLLDENACSVLYHYKGQKIIFHPRGTVSSRSCSHAVSLPLDEETEQEGSHTHTQTMDLDTRTQRGWRAVKALLQEPSSTVLPGPAWKDNALFTAVVLVSSKMLL